MDVSNGLRTMADVNAGDVASGWGSSSDAGMGHVVSSSESTIGEVDEHSPYAIIRFAALWDPQQAAGSSLQ